MGIKLTTAKPKKAKVNSVLKKSRGSRLEELLALQIRMRKVPEPSRELRFHTIRRWRFDFAWPEYKLAVEVEGGTWNQGRHTRGKGFENDCEKYNAAAIEGWKILRFTANMIESGDAIKTIIRALRGE